MTVTSEISRVTYAGNGTTGPFTVPFYFIAADDLVVLRLNADGSTSTFVRNVDHSVTGAGDPSGGSVTTAVAVATGATLVIYRDPPIIQDAAYVDHARFPAASHEKALDKGRMIEQRTRELVERALHLGDADIDGAGAYQAGGNRISGAADGTVLGDVATINQLFAVRDAFATTGPLTAPIYPSRAAVAAATINAGAVPYVRTQGILVAGDEGDGLYKQVGSTSLPAPLSVTSANGVIFELVGKTIPNFKTLGGKGTGGVNEAATFAAVPSDFVVGLADGTYRLDSDVTSLATFICGPGVQFTGTGILFAKMERPREFYPSRRKTLGDIVKLALAGTPLVINVHGDSEAYGFAPAPDGTLPAIPDPATGATDASFLRTDPPWPSAMNDALSNAGITATVNNYSYPGETTKSILQKYVTRSTGPGHLTFFHLLTNDSNPASGISLSDVQRNIALLLHREIMQGVVPVWVAPPMPFDPAQAAAIRPYVTAAQQVCKEFDVPFIDGEQQVQWLIKRVSVDGFHLGPYGNNEFGYHLAGLIFGHNGSGLIDFTPGRIFQPGDLGIVGPTAATGSARSGLVTSIPVGGVATMAGRCPVDVFPVFTIFNPGAASFLKISYSGGKGSVPLISAKHDGGSFPLRRRYFGPRLRRGDIRTLTLTNGGTMGDPAVQIEQVKFVSADHGEPQFASGTWRKLNVSGVHCPFDDQDVGHFWALDYDHALYSTGRVQGHLFMEAASPRCGILVAKAGMDQYPSPPANCLIAGREGTSAFIDQYINGSATRLLGITTQFSSGGIAHKLELRLTATTVALLKDGAAIGSPVAYSATPLGTQLNAGWIAFSDGAGGRGLTCYSMLMSDR